MGSMLAFHQRFGPESEFYTLRLFSCKKTLGSWVISVSVCPNIIPIAPQYSHHLGSQLLLVGVCPNIIPITPQYSYYFR